MKTKTRILAEMVARSNGVSLITVNLLAFEYVKSGICKTHLEALRFMNSL